MADASQMSDIDWEKELTCSICTDILFQPLALLDCLHTFCGACLKEWFVQQASNATSAHPYTCPSCRASVRGTTRHAMMTTFLEQFLKSNPGKGKSEQEQEDVRKLYKPGDRVLPKLRRRRAPGREEEADSQLMEEVRQLSLAEAGVGVGVGATAPTSFLRPLPSPRPTSSTSRSRSRSSDRDRGREGRVRQHWSRESSGSRLESRARPPRVTPSTIAGPPSAREVRHQASLRSLLSASELDSQGLEDEILRQVLEEGLVEGIDWDNIDRTQEEEIQQRILQAFRRRRAAQRQLDEPQLSRSQGGSDAQGSQLEQRSHITHASRPPVSRPHLFDAANDAPRTHQRRSSSQGSSHSSRPRPHPLNLPPSGSEQRASRSTNDLSLDQSRITGSSERPRRASANTRMISDPEDVGGVPGLPAVERSMRGVPERHTNSNPASPNPAQTAFNVADSRPHATFPITQRSAPAPERYAYQSPTTTSPGAPQSPTPTNVSNDNRRTEYPGVLFTEPFVTCDRCQKRHVEYFQHYHCSKCPSDVPTNDEFNLCLSCYRHGKGCHHWFGYTIASAALKHARHAIDFPPSQQAEEPHMLVGRRWKKPRQAPIRSSSDQSKMVTDEDPALRLEAGVFCDSCGISANTCYWKCDVCNDGAWGYCSTCVNQFKHCTHPLLPLSHKTYPPSTATNPGFHELNAGPPPSDPPLTPKSLPSPLLGIRHPTILSNLPFYPQQLITECDICHCLIQPSMTRFHCPDCNAGDYDICTSCYQSLASKNRIVRSDGPHGWRRCLQAHRMGVVGFEDREGGQWRIVVAERVGGAALKEEGGQRAPASGVRGERKGGAWSWRDDDGSTSHSRNASRSPLPSPSLSAAIAPRLSATGGLDLSTAMSTTQQVRFPPSGGVGLIVQALYGWWPAEGTRDELMFPKGAEIREAEDINGDWFWGCYAGGKGLFPGNYGSVVGRVD